MVRADGPQLRVWAAALEGFRFVSRNWVTVLWLVLPPAVVISAAHIALSGVSPPPVLEAAGFKDLLVDFGELAVAVLLAAVILVAWQRRILLGPGASRPRFGWRELNMIAAVSLIGIVLIAVRVAAVLLAIPVLMLGSGILADGIGVVAWVAAIYLIGRLYFILPPIAIDRAMSFRESWQMSGPQALKLMLIVALVAIPFEVLSAFASRVAGIGFYGEAPFLLAGATLLENVLFMLYFVVEAAAMTFCYAALGGVRQIMEARGIEPDPETAPA